PSRSLIGYQGEFLTDTRGSGVLNRVFSHYEPYKGPIDAGRKGVLVSNGDGETAAFALWNLEDRGFMFVGAGEKTDQGMLIGENSRADDLDVNPMKAKQLTNVRASGKDEAVRLTPPRRPTLEQAIAYIEEDELVEVTPNAGRVSVVVGCAIYAVGVVAMLAFSTAYNFASHEYRPMLRRLDHAGIFVMIAGSYTPFTLGLPGAWGPGMTTAVWTIASLG